MRKETLIMLAAGEAAQLKPHKDVMTAAAAVQFKPRDFVVNFGGGERLSDAVRDWLDPVYGWTLNVCNFTKDQLTTLHYHELDEYWLWTKGQTMVTIRLPDGRRDTFKIGPGWVVYCVRGVEHGHQPLEDWGCYQHEGIRRPAARRGHLDRKTGLEQKYKSAPEIPWPGILE